MAEPLHRFPFEPTRPLLMALKKTVGGCAGLVSLWLGSELELKSLGSVKNWLKSAMDLTVVVAIAECEWAEIE